MKTGSRELTVYRHMMHKRLLKQTQALFPVGHMLGTWLSVWERRQGSKLRGAAAKKAVKASSQLPVGSEVGPTENRKPDKLPQLARPSWT